LQKIEMHLKRKAVNNQANMYSQSINKPKIMAPPVQYPLIQTSPEKVCAHLDYLTRLDIASPNYLAHVKQTLYEQHQTKPIIFGYIPAPPLERITKQVIGYKGHFFKMTTTLCGVYFIWHDAEANMFCFWGASKFSVVKAMNSIRWRIVKCYELMNESAQQASTAEQAFVAQQAFAMTDDPETDEDFYADMPELVSCGNSPRQISSGSVPDYEHPFE
jgi:hypothetical protein